MAVTELPVTTVTADDVQTELNSLLQTQFTDWTDTQDSNNMIMMTEVMAAIAELEYAYVNRLARECFIQFALDPRNVYAHAQGLGYTPQFQTSAIVSAVIQSASVLTADTTIPAGTQFNSVLNAVYETIADVIIRAGQTQSTSVQLSQRQSWTDSFTGTGAGNQSIVLDQTPVMPNSIVVVINGVTWTYVVNFVDSDSTDTVYTWSEDGTGTATVSFGNGITGKNPTSNAVGQVSYQTGGGSATSIPANGLGTCISDVTDSGSGVLLSLSAYNALSAVPGADVETLAQIKAHAVDNLITPRVLITRLDVQNAVAALPGVLACTAVNWEIEPTLGRNSIQVFVMPVGGGVASPDLLNSIITYLTTVKQIVMGVTPTAFTAQYVTLNFVISMGTLSGFTLGAVQNQVIAALVAMFNPLVQTPNFTIGFGLEVFMSQVIAQLQQIAGVQNINITAPGDTVLALNQYPILGTVNFA